MATISKKTTTAMKNPSFSGRSYNYGILGLGIVLLVALASMSSGSESDNSRKATTALAQEDTTTAVTIALEEVSGIPFYQCQSGDSRKSAGDSDDKVANLVLLHGARFTKEDWKNPPGILDDFCSRTTTTNKQLNVLALDLPVKADFDTLAQLLDDLASAGKLTKPVSLVTPSASGKTMVTGAALGDFSRVKSYIRQWIPVAALAVNSAPESNLQTLQDLPILAIYGDQDAPGKQSSLKLEANAQAKVLELQGQHPAYLDSPKEFVDAVVQFMGVV